MPKIAVTDYTFDNLAVEKGVLEPLGYQLVFQKSGNDHARLVALVKDADYVLTQFATINREVITAMQNCRLIVRYGIGVDNVDLAAAAAKRIPVCNVPDYCTDEVAEHTLGMILELTRRISQNAAKVRSGGWGLAVPLQQMHTLREMTVGIVAYGRIGREVAMRLKPFKCRILVTDPGVAPEHIRKDGFEPVALDELYSRSNLVTLHCPSTEVTRQMINTKSIEKMKRGVLLVNVSRGSLVRTDDLITALSSGAVGAVALDVIDPEPINPDNPLVAMNNVIINSHIASASPHSSLKLRLDAAGTIAAAIRGDEVQNIVNDVRA